MARKRSRADRRTPRGTATHGVRAWQDGHHKTLYYPSNESSGGTQRFDAFRRAILARSRVPMKPEALSLACLIAFDAPCLPDLPAIYGALGRPYRVRQWVAIEWMTPHRVVDRRLLSPFTVAALRAHDGARWPSFDEAMTEVLSSAGFHSVDDLQAAAGSWLLAHAPTWLLPRIMGSSRSASLPRSALARWASGLVVVQDDPLPPLSNDDLELLDGCESEGDDGDEDLFEEVIKACREAPRLAPHVQRESMLVALRTLIPRALRAGPFSCQILRFALDLVEHGTRRYGILAAGSIEEYVRLLVGQVAHLLRGIRASSLGRAQLEGFYRAVISAAGELQASKAIPACKAFHVFLRDSYDVGAWPLTDVAEIPSKPHAQVVFDHERECIWLRLDTDDWSDPMHWRVLVLFAIYCSSPRRKQDGAVIRIGGIREHDGRVLLDVDPNPLLDAELKGDRVSVEITDARCIRVLLTARDMRRAEGADDDDKLLGSRDAPRVAWRFEACHALVIRLCKWAAGDRDVDAHCLRHTHLTKRLMEADIDQRELDQLSADAGHVGDATILDDYGHAFEFAARRAMDSACCHFEMTSLQVEAWTGIKAATVRKHWSRARESPADVSWQLLQDAASGFAVEDVTHGFVMGEPGAFELPAMNQQKARISCERILAVLQDLCATDEPWEQAQIASRRTTAQETVAAIASSVTQRFAPRAWERSRFEAPTVLDALTAAPMRIDVSRARQPKCRQLLAWLERLSMRQARDVETAWLRAARADGYVIDELSDVLPLIKVFRDAGFGASRVVLAHATPHREAAALVSKLAVLLGGAPTIEALSLNPAVIRPPAVPAGAVVA